MTYLFGMSDHTKIMLSHRELAIVADREFILTKHRIIQQVFCLFEQQVPNIQALFGTIWRQYFSFDSLPKISKGEQYRQLPYVVMDYPAIFKKTDRWAIRTLFCWGDAFSITLQLTGQYKMLFIDRIVANAMVNRETAFYIGVNENEWEHHFEEDNYRLLISFTQESLMEHFHQLPHIKIALRYPLAQWNNMNQLFKEGYKMMSDLLKPIP